MSLIPLVIILVVVFAGLVVALRWILKTQMSDATTHLESLSQDYLKKQEGLKQRLEEADRYYQEQLAKAQSETEQMSAQAARQADTTRQKVMAQAREEADRIVQQAMESRDALTHELEQGMEHRAIQRACELIEKTLSAELRQEIHTRWLDEVLDDGLGQLDRLHVTDDAQEIVVRSAFPLTDGQRDLLQQKLLAKLAHPLAIKEETDPQLIAGLILSLGSLVLDGSMASKLREAARHAQDAGKA